MSEEATGRTTDQQVGPAARFFESFTVGEVIHTQGRTITETDASMWAMLTGDMNPMHVDETYARAHGLFGGRFPPGMLSVALATGLQERLGLFAGTGLAMLEQSIRYRKPAMVGDTVHVELVVLDTEPHPGKPRGRVRFGYEIIDADGEVNVEGEWVIVVAASPAT